MKGILFKTRCKYTDTIMLISYEVKSILQSIKEIKDEYNI